LKLHIDTADIPKFHRYPLLIKNTLSSVAAEQCNSIYFDTPDLYFKKNNYVLRVRLEKQHWIQTLKHKRGKTPELLDSKQWESPVDGPHPDLASLLVLMGKRRRLTRILKKNNLEEQLEPIFGTKMRRTIWHLLSQQGDEIELTLELGEIECGKAKQDINELELALTSGNPEALFDLALDMQHKIPLRLGNQSEVALGYALYAPQLLPLQKNASVRLAPNASLEEAINIIVDNCLEQVRGNEMGVMQGNDSEHIHQMRIGLRRLRLALELFSEVFPHDMALQEDLEWVAAELGATRNWEVLAFDTLNSIGKAFPEEVEALTLVARNIAARQRRHAAIIVGSARYARLLLTLGAWIQGVRCTVSLDVDKNKQSHRSPDFSVKKFSSYLLAHCRRKLLQRGAALGEGDPYATHQLRIAAKKLRYTAEFFQSLQSEHNAGFATAALSNLLGTLGEFHDISFADTLLGQLAQLDPPVAKEANFARGYLAAKTERNSKKVNRIWQRFRIESAL